MKHIYIKGKFTIEGDLPALDMMTQPMKSAHIEISDIVVARISEFSAIREDDENERRCY